MQWTSDAIVLATRRHGESSVILEAMTPDHGRHLGLVRGGRSPRVQPTLQPGNGVRLTWRARLDEHLGHYTAELTVARAAALMEGALGLAGIQTIAAHLRLLPERDPHPRLYAAALEVLGELQAPGRAAAHLALFELLLLEELGFGLDLSSCAVTGARAELVYVSPKSGRAVSRAAGAPYGDRLFGLPAFLVSPTAVADDRDAAAALALTGFFLERHVTAPRGIALPLARGRLVAAVAAPAVA